MIFLADRQMTVQDAVDHLKSYPSKTPKRYDLPPCALGPVTHEEIVRTRAVSSRISKAEGEWFQEVSQAWDWTAIPQDASLIDADAEEAGGLYDLASHMYGHFWSARRPGVNVAKISKVLHLKYPALVPILDSHLLALYRSRAFAVAQHSDRWRGRVRHLYWEAIRQDLLRSDLSPVRDKIKEEPSLASLNLLTDLRLLDALAWRLSPGQA